MTPAQEAAAMWGSASNVGYSDEARLAMALQALEFFGNEFDRLRSLYESLDRENQRLRLESVHAPAAMYGKPGREPICDFDCGYCVGEAP